MEKEVKAEVKNAEVKNAEVKNDYAELQSSIASAKEEYRAKCRCMLAERIMHKYGVCEHDKILSYTDNYGDTVRINLQTEYDYIKIARIVKKEQKISAKHACKYAELRLMHYLASLRDRNIKYGEFDLLKVFSLHMIERLQKTRSCYMSYLPYNAREKPEYFSVLDMEIHNFCQICKKEQRKERNTFTNSSGFWIIKKLDKLKYSFQYNGNFDRNTPTAMENDLRNDIADLTLTLKK